MAGLGWRKFAAGEVLTANNFQSYGVDQTVQRYAGTAARGSAIGTAVAEGMVSYLDDTNVVQAYDGAAWNSLAYVSSVKTPGLIPVVPTSVDKSGGTATANSTGTVTYSGTSLIRLNGVFSSTYKNYKIVIRNTDLSAGVEIVAMRFSAAGTDTTSSSYKYVTAVTGAPDTYTTKQNGSNGTNRIGLAYFAYGDAMREINVYTPNTTNGTHIRGIGGYDYGAIVQVDHYGTLLNSTQYDGFSLYPETGNFTGSLTVYGIVD